MSTPADAIRAAATANALTDERVLKHLAWIQALQMRAATLLNRRLEIEADLPRKPLLAPERDLIDIQVREIRAQQRFAAEKAATFLPAF